MEFFEDGSCVKTVHEKGLTTHSFSVREEVEELETTRIGLGLLKFTNRRINSGIIAYEVCVVRMGWEGDSGVRSVTVGQVGGKLPKATVWKLLVNILLWGMDGIATLRFSNEIDSSS